MNTSLTLALLLKLAATGLMSVADGDEVGIPVGPSGVTLQLPEFVRVVTPSQDYIVKALTAPQASTGAGASAAEHTDIRVFIVRPTRSTPSEQRVTFVMGNGRSVTARLLPGTARDENFVGLRWSERKTQYGPKTRGADQFLAGERTLLLSMLRDERTLGRKVLEQPVPLPAYPDLEVVLVRSYEADGMVGAVYTFTNRSNKALQVNPTVLAVGTPNRAVLTQMDHSELRSCNEDSSSDPRGRGCMSAVRIVARGRLGGGGPLLLGVDQRTPMPFVVVKKDKP